MKKVLAALLMLSLLVGGIAAAEEMEQPKPTKVVLADSKTVTVYIDAPVELGYQVYPEDADTSQLKWTTSSKKIATVADGAVTPVKEGTATITVKTPNGKKDSVKVKVVDPYKPTKVVLDMSGTISVSMGQTLELNAALQPESAKSELKWTTSSKKIAVVDENGVVTPVKEGTATITVKTANGKKDTVKVKVFDPYKPAKVVLDQSGTVTLSMGEVLELNAALQPESAQSRVKWSTSSKKIATVDENGVVTPVKEGTATITVTTHNGKKDSVKVKVVDPYKPAKVVLDKSGTVELETGKTVQLYAALEPATAKSELKWKSSSAKVAKVDENGLVTAVKAGTATITVTTANGKKDTVKIKVGEVPWTPNPDYKELKEAIRNTKWGAPYVEMDDWRKDSLLGSISGLKELGWRDQYNYSDICDAPYAQNERVEYEASHVKFTFGNWYKVLLEPGAKYSIYGFHPGMSLADAKKNISMRKDLKNVKNHSLRDGWGSLYIDPKISMVYWKEYLDLGLYVYYKNNTIQAVAFEIFIGA